MKPALRSSIPRLALTAALTAGIAASSSLPGHGALAQQTLPRIRLGTTDKVNSFDLANVWTVFGENVVQGNVVEGLTRYDLKTGKVVPNLALTWTRNPAGTLYTFKLRPKVTFHDGTPLTADAVKFSFQRMATLKGPGAYLLSDVVDTDNIKVVDPLTVQIPLKFPYGGFLDRSTSFLYGIISPKTPAALSPNTLIGTGPYKLTSWQEGTRITLDLNPKYWGAKPQNSGITITQYSQSSNLKFALQKGEIDLAWRDLGLSDIKEIVASPEFDASEGLGQIRYLVLNTRVAPLDKVEVRQAVAAAINRPEISKVVYNNLIPGLYSMVPGSLPGAKPSFKTKYGEQGNLEMAKSLLAKAGFTAQKPATLDLWFTPTHYGPEESTLAIYLKQQLEATGAIKVNLKSAEWTPYVTGVTKGELTNMSLLGWATLFPTAEWFTGNVLSETALKNQGSGYDNPEIFDLVSKQGRALRAADADKIAGQLQDLVADTVPYVPLVQAMSTVVKRKEVSGVNVAPGTYFVFSTIQIKK